jgi:diguanylate cyclase (GGDEF)-like protein
MLNDRLEQEAQRVGRHGGQVALLLLDLDHFKSVNDNYGHDSGDQLLIQVARRLRETARGTDMLARLGGDEFALLQSGVRNPKAPADLAVRIIRGLAPAFDLPAQRIYTGASIGIAVSGEAKADPAELMRQADLALYRTK